MQKYKVNGQSAPKIKWENDGQTGRQTDGGDCITSVGNAIGDDVCFVGASTQQPYPGDGRP